MKEKKLKPEFHLTRVYGDGSQEPVEIVPLSQAIRDANMNRRGFFTAGITATAALILLNSCDPDEPEPEPGSETCSCDAYNPCSCVGNSKTCQCHNVGNCSCNQVCTCNKVCTTT